MGKKPIVSITYENERISIKKQLTLLKMCVTSLLCGPRDDLWPFYGFLCKRFYFARSLRKHRNLKVKRVHFLYNKPQESVTDEGAKYLAEALKDGNCTLNGLDLRRNNRAIYTRKNKTPTVPFIRACLI